MKRASTFIVALMLVVGIPAAQGQRDGRGQGEGRGFQGQRRGGPPRPPMDSTPKMFDTKEYRIRVVTVTEGLSYPYSFTFLPDGSMLVNELQGRLRVIRDGKLSLEPISGLPDIHYAQGRGGLMDIILHPKFAQNHLVYFTYDKPGEKGATQAVARGKLDGNKLTGVQDIFVTENWGKAEGHLSARIAFGRDGMLYMAISDHNQSEAVATGTSHAGKVIRITEDGKPPAKGPFGGDYRPEIFATGFRDPHSMVLIPGTTNDFWEVEHGDELNLVKAGGNYGWPFISSGEGNSIGPPPAGVKMTDPYLKQWPVFHFSGLLIYSGDKFPKWKGNVFIGCLETEEIHRVVLGKDATAFRESLFKELGQQVRDVRQGPDGYIYFTTNDPMGRVMRVEPAS